MGDFIVALPTLAALRRAFPEAALEAAAPAAWLPLAGDWAGVLRPLEAADWGFLHGDAPPPARMAGMDLAVVLRPDPAGDMRRALLAAGIRRVLVHNPTPDGPAHIIDHLNRSLAVLGIEAPAWPDLRGRFTPPGLRESGDGSPRPGVAAIFHGAVVLHPGSGGQAKRWPAERFRLLAQWLAGHGKRPVIVLGPAELERGEERFWQGEGWPVVPAPTILELGAGLAAARLYAGNDSGASHLAAAVGCPALALFGPTDPAIWAPRGPHAWHLRAPGGLGDVNRPPSMANLSFETVRDFISGQLSDTDFTDIG